MRSRVDLLGVLVTVIVRISIICSCRVCMGTLMPDPLDQPSYIRDHLDMGMVEDIARVLGCHWRAWKVAF